MSNVLKLFPFPQEHCEYVDIDGTLFRINIPYNFNRLEFDALPGSGKAYLVGWTTYAPSYFEDTSSLNKNELAYARRLAFFRRIDLDLIELLSAPLNVDSYPMSQVKNFIVFDELFERYYGDFDKINKNNNKLKSNFKKQCDSFVLKLWLSGYGLFPDFTHKHITDEFLAEMVLKLKGRKTNVKKVLRFLSFILLQEKDSPVNNICKLQESTPLVDRELGKWSKELYDNFEIGIEFQNFVMSTMLSRTEKPVLLKYKDKNNKEIRETLSKIALNTFVTYSGSLRNMFIYLKEIGCYTIQDALDGGIRDVLANKYKVLKKTTYDNMKIVTKMWLDFYIKSNNLDLNINRIIIPNMSNRDTQYGQVLNYADVTIFVDALLNDNLPFYENLKLVDYRSRYMALLLLSSGQRYAEISRLKYDCLKTDKTGRLHLVIHKTKTTDGNLILASPDIIDYVKKLRAVAPKRELHFSSKDSKIGDDETVKRLIANKYDDGPLENGSFNDFLFRLQKYIWGESLEKKDNIFTAHDFRRIRAVYMSLSGYSSEDIKQQLGQTSLSSQIPYLQTKPAEHQKHFEEIYKKGIYKIDDNDDVLINSNEVYNKAKDLIVENSYQHKNLVESILSGIKSVDDITIKSADVTSLEPTGFPIGLYACSAGLIVNCNKSPIKCFSCKNYVPDIDSLDDHKVEIFRYLLLSKNQSKALKNSKKDMVVQNIVGRKIAEIDKSIDNAFAELFGKFKMDSEDTQAIRKDLEEKASKYMRKYGKTNPLPSFKDAKAYLEGGKI